VQAVPVRQEPPSVVTNSTEGEGDAGDGFGKRRAQKASRRRVVKEPWV